jgi:hypothetical protein
VPSWLGDIIQAFTFELNHLPNALITNLSSGLSLGELVAWWIVTWWVIALVDGRLGSCLVGCRLVDGRLCIVCQTRDDGKKVALALGKYLHNIPMCYRMWQNSLRHRIYDRTASGQMKYVLMVFSTFNLSSLFLCALVFSILPVIW